MSKGSPPSTTRRRGHPYYRACCSLLVLMRMLNSQLEAQRYTVVTTRKLAKFQFKMAEPISTNHDLGMDGRHSSPLSEGTPLLSSLNLLNWVLILNQDRFSGEGALHGILDQVRGSLSDDCLKVLDALLAAVRFLRT